MQRVYDFLKETHSFFLATVDGDQARVRPFGAVDLFDGKLYIQTGRQKACYRQMKDNPKIEICALRGSEWLRIQATAVEDNRIDAEAHMLDANPNLKKMYAAGDGNIAVFALTDATATFSSFSADPIVICF